MFYRVHIEDDYVVSIPDDVEDEDEIHELLVDAPDSGTWIKGSFDYERLDGDNNEL